MRLRLGIDQGFPFLMIFGAVIMLRADRHRAHMRVLRRGYVRGRPDLVDLDTRHHRAWPLLLPFAGGTVFLGAALATLVSALS